ncbi:helix-turn-helix domain-containing protein [Nocardia sp. NRRL S-836]|uniref:helix-turn-helix domain-containing protein n=1 Tax=Nocardia sp. NRRL S-836 TaxID=1519492 RepID=UPI0006AEF38E|nr:helix-turn-helix domain-containing protein [Nocardia sp. NRRL S-836]KOV82442.1 transcriptional regulator [Nocardia sp. NRRL S-836]
MVRLTRVQQQARTRALVLAAAKEEFAEHGFGPAKVDRIAERAELTRGAVYSNFPSKRALYLAVLIDLVETAAVPPEGSPLSKVDALGVFARVWLERLPLVGDSAAGGRLQLRSLDGVLDDAHGVVLAQVARLEALLLAVALERGGPARQVRLAELVLTLLDGAVHRAETSPGFGDPFDVAHACRHLAQIDLADAWAPPHLPYVAPARTCAETWSTPGGLVDLLGGGRGDLADGVVVVLGAGRLGAAEEAVRAAKAGEQVVLVVVTSDPEETGRLVRLRLSDVAGCLRRVFEAAAWQDLRVVLDEGAAVASALGVEDPGDGTEAAVRVRDGVIVSRAQGLGAGHAVAAQRKKATS